MTDKYVYYDRETAAIVAIVDEPDETLAATYSHFMAPPEFMETLIIKPAEPDTGYLYYDPKTGLIQGVSLSRNQDMFDRWGCLEVTPEVATPFLTGEMDVGHYFVDVVMGSGLMRLDALEVGSIDTTVQQLPREPIKGLMTLKVSLSTKDNIIAFRFNSSYSTAHLRILTKTITAIITRKDDPTAIIASVPVDVSELVRNKLVVKSFVAPPFKSEPAVFMKRIVPATWVEVGDVTIEALPMPRVAEDLFRFERVQKPRRASLTAKIDRSKGRVRLIYDEAAGPRYDRRMFMFPVLFTKNRDPSVVYAGAKLDLEALMEKGKIDIAIPPDLLDTDFDLYSPLFFQSMIAREFK